MLRAVLDRGEAALDPLRPFGGGLGQDDELRTGLPAFYFWDRKNKQANG